MGLWGNWNWGGGVAVEDVDCCFRFDICMFGFWI